MSESVNKQFKIEWIPMLLEHIASLTDLEPEMLQDIRSAQVLMQEKNLKIQKKKLKKEKKQKKRKKHPPYSVSVEIVGKLPHCLSAEAFRAAVIPMFEDLFNGKVVYRGFNRMNNGTYCYNFSGICPIHLRQHENVGYWQLKQHTNAVWCGFKCWKQDSYKKVFSNQILCDF